MTKLFLKGFIFMLFLPIAFLIVSFSEKEGESNCLSPSDFWVDGKGKYLYVTELSQNRVDIVDIAKKKIKRSVLTGLPPKAIVSNNEEIFVVTSHSEGELLILDKKLNVKKTIAVGKGACDVVLSRGGDFAYTANQFSEDVSFVNLISGKEEARVPVLRQPMVLEISKDGRYLFVANFITDSRADIDTVTSKISIIDIAQKSKIKDIPLANGSNALRGISISEDGNYVFIVHNLGRFQMPTSQLDRGWMNTSALSVIDARGLEYVATVLLDEPGRGAAGSWGIDCTGEYIVVAHSGTHDFSLINYNSFIEKLINYSDKESLSHDLRFLTNIRERINIIGNGPRAIMIDNERVYVANYFSDNINLFSLKDINKKDIITLNDNLQMTSSRLGEMYFHDASFCFQEWQSCTGCHPNNARTDGLNWDLLNDGIGNPKNCRSLLLAHYTPPSMITGIRPSAETAVRAGFKYIQFAMVEEEKCKAVDDYLKSIEPIPSPYLISGALTNNAKKGKMVFEQLNCSYCHPAPYYTDMKQHEMGIQGEFDRQNKWDTPTLIEVWRTPPYLHDGRSATLKEVFSIEKHGIEANISNEDMDCLVEYVLSL